MTARAKPWSSGPSFFSGDDSKVDDLERGVVRRERPLSLKSLRTRGLKDLTRLVVYKILRRSGGKSKKGTTCSRSDHQEICTNNR